MIKITILECETVEEFVGCMAELNKNKEAKVEISKVAIDLPDIRDVGKKEFERLMAEKGYKSTSQRAKTRQCKKFNIGRVKEGGKWRYPIEDILKVPESRQMRIKNLRRR